MNIGVVITTYNSPLWLQHVLSGYAVQDDRDFTIIIADDGSGADTEEVIREFEQRCDIPVHHVWHEDKGFRKTIILNNVIAHTDCDYLIFTDGDCIPRSDFISVHRANSEPGYFLSGGYIKLTMGVSQAVEPEMISSKKIFSRRFLLSLGQPNKFKLTKLTTNPFLVKFLNCFTPTKATWNGMNSSGWLEDIKSVNGFDERMQYGGLDRELGERLVNKGIRSKQIRYSAVCLHLDHARGYAKPEIWEKNRSIRADVKATKRSWTEFGVLKQKAP